MTALKGSADWLRWKLFYAPVSIGDAALLSQLREELGKSQAEAQRWQSLHTQLMEFTARKVGASDGH